MWKVSILFCVLSALMGPWADACQVGEFDAITLYTELVELSGEESEAARVLSELAEWETLIDAISGLEGGSLDERIALANVIYGQEYLAALDYPPGGDLTLTEHAVERLRGYVATEPKAWLVYQISRDLWDVDRDEIAPLLLDLASHASPSVRADAIDNIYNVLFPEDWTSWEDVERQLEELWARETHPRVKTVLVEALAYYEVELSHQTLVRLLADDDDDLAEATIDYLVEVEPEGWIDLLLRLVTRGERGRGRQAIIALTDVGLAEAETNRVRIFFESRVDSTRYTWVRPEILTLLESLDSTIAESEIRKLLWSSNASTAITGIDLLKRMRVTDWPAIIARRALEGEVEIRERALFEIALLPWDPAFDAVVTRVANESKSGRLAFAALVALGTPDDPASDRSHLAHLWKPLDLKSKSLGEKSPEGLAGEPDAFDPHVTHVVVAPPGYQTVRCFPAPDCEGPPEKAQRVPTGHPISGELFEDVSAAWLEADAITEDDCWVNASHAVPRDEYRPAEPETDARREVDLALVTLRSPEFIQLKRFNVLETFDMGTRLAGCRLTIDVRDSKRLERLRKATHLSRTNLANGVRQLLPEIKSTYGSLDGWEAWVNPSNDPDR